MPCVYDDVPGSWGSQSEGWPAVHDPNMDARRLVIKDNLVPYGSYVTVGEYLRLETAAYVETVKAALAGSQGEGVGEGIDPWLEAVAVPLPESLSKRIDVLKAKATTQDPAAPDGDALVDALIEAAVGLESAQANSCSKGDTNHAELALTKARAAVIAALSDQRVGEAVEISANDHAMMLVARCLDMNAESCVYRFDGVTDAGIGAGDWIVTVGCAPTHSDAVAEVVKSQPDGYSANHRIKWLVADALPVGTKLYTAPPTAIPDGMVVVPENPTIRMEDAGLKWLSSFQHMRKQDRRNALANAYVAMLAAAPGSAEGGK